LFQVKLSCGKLVTEAFHHTRIICGARKSFLELITLIRNSTELVDLQQEIEKAPQANPACNILKPFFVI
jgi:hypothetical protein